MSVARHPRPPDVADLSLDEIAERYIGRFRDKTPDWEAFEDAKIEGYRRAHPPLIRPRGPREHHQPRINPPPALPLGVLSFPPRAGHTRHTHTASGGVCLR